MVKLLELEEVGGGTETGAFTGMEKGGRMLVISPSVSIRKPFFWRNSL